MRSSKVLKGLFATSLALLLTGCGYGGMGRGGMGGLMGVETDENGQPIVAGMPDAQAMTAKMNFQQELMKNPDLPIWYETREKMALAVGDRVFDKGFDRVFDSMTVALANLGCRVSNMERVSGYITATIPQLSPALRDALRKESMAQYAAAKGYPPTVLTKQGPYDVDFDMSAMMERQGGAGLTLSMVRQGATQTKVKLRFDGIYYPATVSELYKVVWAEVDKQMFLDKALD
ncbi:MAG: hypothetical protein K0Q76_502 [Panacagrimonas sp.]|jgi:hypothetical protein|nr:hypothetical protein [Panacagrimonas sp.]MCC2655394.1 hypothetical protein [Panacagrimonas sp.]